MAGYSEKFQGVKADCTVCFLVISISVKIETLFKKISSTSLT